MVTGDLNAALVEWVVQYRISDPVKFLKGMSPDASVGSARRSGTRR
jgi:regulator of protease activity HflC (stomatin/prohibitin superfamily)